MTLDVRGHLEGKEGYVDHSEIQDGGGVVGCERI